jgi:hypothetical protein
MHSGAPWCPCGMLSSCFCSFLNTNNARFYRLLFRGCSDAFATSFYACLRCWLDNLACSVLIYWVAELADSFLNGLHGLVLRVVTRAFCSVSARCVMWEAIPDQKPANTCPGTRSRVYVCPQSQSQPQCPLCLT